MKSDFVKCGILGWCIEIIWTAFHGIKNKNNNKGKIEIEYYSQAELERIYEMLKKTQE